MLRKSSVQQDDNLNKMDLILIAFRHYGSVKDSLALL